MKIKSVVDICKKSGFMYLITMNDGTQWLGDGVAYYPLIQAPEFSEDSFYATFDITEKEAEGIIFRKEELPDGFNFSNDADEELFAERNEILISYRGKDYCIYHALEGALYINAKYLKPIEKDKTEVYIRRTPKGTPYFVYKVGFMAQAIVAPLSFNSGHKDFFENLSILYKGTKKRMEGIIND